VQNKVTCEFYEISEEEGRRRWMSVMRETELRVALVWLREF